MNSPSSSSSLKHGQMGQVTLYGIPLFYLVIDNMERLSLAQISKTLLKNYSSKQIRNRRLALGVTYVECTLAQRQVLHEVGALPIQSRCYGMITKEEAELLCGSFLGQHAPLKLPDNFTFNVSHECAWGCHGNFIPALYNSSQTKCIKCTFRNTYFSPNKFISHSHYTLDANYMQPKFKSWRLYLKLSDEHPSEELMYAWMNVRTIFYR